MTSFGDISISAGMIPALQNTLYKTENFELSENAPQNIEYTQLNALLSKRQFSGLNDHQRFLQLLVWCFSLRLKKWEKQKQNRGFNLIKDVSCEVLHQLLQLIIRGGAQLNCPGSIPVVKLNPRQPHPKNVLNERVFNTLEIAKLKINKIVKNRFTVLSKFHEEISTNDSIKSTVDGAHVYSKRLQLTPSEPLHQNLKILDCIKSLLYELKKVESELDIVTYKADRKIEHFKNTLQ